MKRRWSVPPGAAAGSHADVTVGTGGDMAVSRSHRPALMSPQQLPDLTLPISPHVWLCPPGLPNGRSARRHTGLLRRTMSHVNVLSHHKNVNCFELSDTRKRSAGQLGRHNPSFHDISVLAIQLLYNFIVEI